MLGVETTSAEGFEGAAESARALPPAVVLCDYDLLTTIPLDRWERDPFLSRVPLVAVSLTRRPDDTHLLDVNGIAGFLYLPAISGGDALALVTAAARARAADERTRDGATPEEPTRGVTPPPGARTPGYRWGDTSHPTVR